MRPPTSLLLVSSATATLANKHHIFVGSYGTPDIFNLEFNTNTNTLKQVARFPAHAGHSELVLNYDKKILYGTERNGWSSYNIDSAGKVRFQSNLTVDTTPCPGESSNIHGRTSVFAQGQPPYNIFGSAQRSCGNVISTKPDGSLSDVLQSINYGPNSRIFDMVADPNNKYVYSADLKENGIWVHQVDSNNGALTPVTFTAFPEADARPRALTLHSNSKYLYVLLSKTNTVGVYEVNGPSLTFTGVNYSIIPRGLDPNRYVGQDILMSADGNVLYTSARYIPPRAGVLDPQSASQQDIDKEDEDETDPFNWYNDNNQNQGQSQTQDQTGDNEDDDDDSKRRIPKLPSAGLKPAKRAVNPPGYITAIQLTENASPNAPQYGPGAPGFPGDVILQIPTTTGGGRSNDLIPAPWGNDYFALTDSERGMVQVWKVEGLSQVLSAQKTAQVPTATKQKRQSSDASQPGYLGDLLSGQPAPSQDPNFQPQPQQPPPGQQSPPPQDPSQQQQGGPPRNPDGSISGYQPAQDPSQQQQQQPPQGQQPSGGSPFGSFPPPSPQDSQPLQPPPQSQPQPPPQPYMNQPYPQGSQYTQPQQPPQQPPQQQAPPPYIPPPQYQPPAYQPPVYQPPAPVLPVPQLPALPQLSPWGAGPISWPSFALPKAAPPPPVVTPVHTPGLLTGLLGGVVGGGTGDPGVTGALLGTNGGRGLLGGGGLLGLGILKKREVVANAPSQVVIGSLPGITAKIVAEWSAPRDAVGTADVQAMIDETYDRRPINRLPSVAQRAARRTKRNSNIPVGSGCCSSAVWFD